MNVLVRRAVGLVTVQDLGRRGHMHEGVPPGGALVPELLSAANLSAGNRHDAAAIEVLGQLVVAATTNTIVAIDDNFARELAPGDELTVASGRRRAAYLAIRGGVAAPRWLGSRSMLVSAGLGVRVTAGLELPVEPTADSSAGSSVGSSVGSSAESSKDADPQVERFVDGTTISILPVTDAGAFERDALSILTSAPYRIAPSSNRTGSRLDGPRLPRRADFRERSRPMVCGALEVPRDGAPIVLGPEHPTTGGYPLIAVIANAELGRFHAIPLGGQVRFTLTSSR
jgi:5-oxoprolinase (ATP-hydrolysing) subunit C